MSLNITTNLEGLETHQNDKELSQTGNNGTSVIFSSNIRVKTLFNSVFFSHRMLLMILISILGSDIKDKDVDPNHNLKKTHVKKYPYPKGVPFIISTEFCERFSYYGMKS